MKENNVTEFELGTMTELTSRQRQVAELAADGHTVEEIAADLNISTSTTRSHLDAARRKLGVRRKREIGRALKGQ